LPRPSPRSGAADSKDTIVLERGASSDESGGAARVLHARSAARQQEWSARSETLTAVQLRSCRRRNGRRAALSLGPSTIRSPTVPLFHPATTRTLSSRRFDARDSRTRWRWNTTSSWRCAQPRRQESAAPAQRMLGRRSRRVFRRAACLENSPGDRAIPITRGSAGGDLVIAGRGDGLDALLAVLTRTHSGASVCRSGSRSRPRCRTKFINARPYALGDDAPRRRRRTRRSTSVGPASRLAQRSGCARCRRHR